MFECIRTLTCYWFEFIHIPIFGYSNIKYLAKNIRIFENIQIFALLWYILMNKYYSVFRIRKISWLNNIWYSVFRNFYEQILFSIWYSENFHERILFSIRYSEIFHERILFGIWYSKILHEWIYSVFSIRLNSLIDATLDLWLKTATYGRWLLMEDDHREKQMLSGRQPSFIGGLTHSSSLYDCSHPCWIVWCHFSSTVNQQPSIENNIPE